SAEYEHYFVENWGAALFVDAGDAYSSDLDANVGAGLGLRWRSPVGLVRLDLAVPVVSDLEEGLRVHVVIGPDLWRGAGSIGCSVRSAHRCCSSCSACSGCSTRSRVRASH